MRVVGSSHADPYSATRRRRRRPLRAAPRRGQRSSHPHAHRDRLAWTTSSPSSPPSRRARRVCCRDSATGSTRATTRGPRSSSSTADEVFAVTGKNPLLDIALKLEEIALSDEYFISRKLYPNVDFYSGPHLPGHGVPARDVPRPLRHPPDGRLAGPLAGDARPGLEDRPAPPALHRRRGPRLRTPMAAR